MWRRGRAPAHERVADELDAYLSGHYVDYLSSHGERVPAWAWLNLLAHGTETEITAERGLLGAHTEALPWTDARSYLAGEVLAVLDAEPVRLRTVQRSVLVPVELRLVGRSTPPVLTLPELVSAVLSSLDAYRRVLRHR